MRRYLNITVMAVVAILCFACNQKKDENKEKEEAAAQAAANAKPQVKIQTVEIQDVPQIEIYTGTVESDVKNNISPNTPYRIEKIYCDVGDYVRKGQVLVQLDRTSLTQQSIQIENQKLAIENAKLAMDNKGVELGRTAELYNIGGASKSEYDSAKLLYDQAVIAYNNAKKQLEVLKTQSNLLGENTQLLAPMSGIVTARNYDDGDMYTATPILTIEQTDPVKLMINVSENYYKVVKPGMFVDVEFDAYQNDVFRGTVTTVYPTIDQSTHTFPVEIMMKNERQMIRPGMYARAKLVMSNVVRVVVPDIAIVKQIGAGDRYVYVYKDGKVSYNKVELGQHLDDKFEVISGLEQDDQVVIAGMSKLANGIEVEVLEDGSNQ